MNFSRLPRSSLSQQRGAAFTIMLVIMIIGVATIFVASLNSSATKIARDKITADALAKAKEALIGYAITYADTHIGQVSGHLPCPDIDSSNGEGGSQLTCGSKNISVLGRLPWKTLDLEALRDSSGECLWYAVSGTYKYNPKTDLMNWDNNGLFQVLAANGAILAGQTVDSYAVAVVVAPGMALSGQSQNRSPNGTAPVCGGNYIASNYLDSDTAIGANNAALSAAANAISQYFTAGTSSNINDQIIFITKSDIFNAIKKRNDFGTFVTNLLNTATACSSQPKTVNFSATPPAETTGVNVGSFIIGRVPQSCLPSPLDNWQDNLLYAKCTSGGCLTVNGNHCNGVVIFSGERNASQTRITNTDKNNLSNYLEGSIYSKFISGSTTFTGASSYIASSPSTDVLVCL